MANKQLTVQPKTKQRFGKVRRQLQARDDRDYTEDELVTELLDAYGEVEP